MAVARAKPHYAEETIKGYSEIRFPGINTTASRRRSNDTDGLGHTQKPKRGKNVTHAKIVFQ